MSIALQSPTSAALSSSSSSLQGRNLRLLSTVHFNFRMPFPLFRSSSHSIDAGLSTELDSVSSFSEIVPDTVIFDDFERFPPTAATVSSSLLLGICSLPDTIFRNAVDMALADSGCCNLENSELRLSCFINKALVNVGCDLAKLVPGRFQLKWMHGLLMTLTELLGSFAQAAAAAQAGASVIQIFVGRLRDWARNHSGDPEIEAALQRGEDPGLALVTKAYNYIHKYGHKSKLMAAAVRNKQDLFSLLGVDYIIAPLKVLQSLKESVTAPDEKHSFVRRLSPQSASIYNFSEEELTNWDQLSLASTMGPASVELLGGGLEGYINQAKRVEELFAKIWPPPNL